MNALRMFREPVVSVRPAEPTDRAAVSALLAGTWRRHGNGSLEDQAALLANGLSTVAFAGSEAVGFWGANVRAPSDDNDERWADVQLVALEIGRRGEGLIGRLTEAALPTLQRYGCTGVVALTPAGWLSDGLAKGGFRLEDQVVTYARNGSHLPAQHRQLRAARLRPATTADASVILEINGRAFESLWRYDEPVILGWLVTSDHAVIAEVDDRPAGFALTTLGSTGNYSHLIRVATDPAYRGLGVGRQLVVDSIRFAHDNRAPGLALNTQASNSVSRQLYESLDFRLTGHTLNVLTFRL